MLSVVSLLTFLYTLQVNGQNTLVYEHSFDTCNGWSTFVGDTCNVDCLLTCEIPVDDSQMCHWLSGPNNPCLRVTGNAYITKTISTYGFYDLRILIDTRAFGLDSGEYCYVAYRTSSITWQENKLGTQGVNSGTNFHNVQINLGAEYHDDPSFEIEIGIWSDAGDDQCAFDNLRIYGTAYPTESPTQYPTQYTIAPTSLTSEPTKNTNNPTYDPTSNPTILPTVTPTYAPTNNPTFLPSSIPTVTPTYDPTNNPTFLPSSIPTVNPTMLPSVNPTSTPTANPFVAPSKMPSVLPSSNPSFFPSLNPSIYPSARPTRLPSKYPTFSPLIDTTVLKQEAAFGLDTIMLYIIIPIIACICILFIIACVMWRHEQKAQTMTLYSEHTKFNTTETAGKVEMTDINAEASSISDSQEDSVININMNENKTMGAEDKALQIIASESNVNNTFDGIDTMDEIIEKGINDEFFKVHNDPEIVGIDHDMTKDGKIKNVGKHLLENTEGKYEQDIDAKLEDDEFVVESFHETEMGHSSHSGLLDESFDDYRITMVAPEHFGD